MNGIAQLYVNCFASEALLDGFPKQLYYFTFRSASYEGSCFSLSPLTLVIAHLFYYSHPSVCEMVFHCGFHFHFPHN